MQLIERTYAKESAIEKKKRNEMATFGFNENQQETNQRASNERKIQPNMKLNSGISSIPWYAIVCFVLRWLADDNNNTGKKKRRKTMLTSGFSILFWSFYQQQMPLQYH